LVEDKDWVNKNMPNAPIEYFWTTTEIEKCLKEDSVEIFSETLDYAPRGVVDLIKQVAWQLPITDLNKIDVIQQKLGFNVQAAMAVMSTRTAATATPAKKERLRQREEA
jgi:hypothetical protein